MSVNPHDAEEQLRPYLSAVFEAFDAERTATNPDVDVVTPIIVAQNRALRFALQLLDVPHTL